jgi:hypothetical protein
MIKSFIDKFVTRSVIRVVLALLVALFIAVKFPEGVEVACSIADVLQYDVEACNGEVSQ